MQTRWLNPHLHPLSCPPIYSLLLRLAETFHCHPCRAPHPLDNLETLHPIPYPLFPHSLTLKPSFTYYLLLSFGSSSQASADTPSKTGTTTGETPSCVTSSPTTFLSFIPPPKRDPSRCSSIMSATCFPPRGLGKLLGWQAANFALFLWTWLGVVARYFSSRT